MKRLKSRYILAAIAGSAVGIAIGGWWTYEELFLPEPTLSLHRSWQEITESDTLRVISVPSTISVFQYNGSWRGHEFEMAQEVAGGLGLKIEMLTAPNEQAMLDSLRHGIADLAAWPVPFSVAEATGGLRPCGYMYEMGLVLAGGQDTDFSVNEEKRYTLAVLKGGRSELATRDPYVRENFDFSPYSVIQVEPDSLATDSLLTDETLTEQIISGRYDATLLPTNLAQLLRSYYPDLKLGRPLIYSEDSIGWMVSAGADTLAAKIDSICSFDRAAPHYAMLAKRYFEKSRGRQVKIRYLLGGGKISVYDKLFRTYSRRLGWDWRLLASVAFVESRFDPHVVSNKGARGLMQLMPATATRFGCPPGMVSDPEMNIQAGVLLIESMENSLRSRISRTKEPGINSYAEASAATRQAVEKDLIYFTMASYNAGIGHVFDAIALADTLGYDPSVWQDNVAYCLSLKSKKEYYMMPCVKHGRFSARVTLEYVEDIVENYKEFCRVAREN